MLRFLLWRLLGVGAALGAVAALAWLLGGGPGRALRGADRSGHGRGSELSALAKLLGRGPSACLRAVPAPLLDAAGLLAAGVLALALLVLALRMRARGRRRYVRLRVEAYRADAAEAPAISRMLAALHGRSLQRWWRRLLEGQPSLALEVHGGGRPGGHAAGPGHSEGAAAGPGLGGGAAAGAWLGLGAAEGAWLGEGAAAGAWLGLVCPAGQERAAEAALQVAYPNTRLVAADYEPPAAGCLLRLKKRRGYIERTATADRTERVPEPPMNRLLTALGACGEETWLQIALTPAPLLFERLAHHAFRRREDEISRRRREGLFAKDRSMLLDSELRGGLELQHRPLFFTDIRVLARTRGACEQVASVLRLQRGENQLVERGTLLRHGLLGLYARRLRRGEGNPLAGLSRSVLAPEELALLWQLPSVDYAAVPFARAGVPLAPAAPAILRAPEGRGVLRDALGPVTIHPELRRQNTAVPGTVEQGKSSYLVATVAEDVRRERCAVIVLDPKGDAADAAISVVPPGRTCTVLDFAHPTCGFNPLDVDAPADVIADYVVGALKNLFTDADIRASSDRFLRNATIAVLAGDRSATLWDAARLLSVGEEGYAYRRAVAARVRALPELKEISAFFTAELTAQLADARSATTAKLDAPVNKLARLLNSASIKRVLLNRSLRVDFDRIITQGEVLIVKGALGAMGAGNTSVLMQLLVGMLDAALARQQDLVPAEQRTAVALKIDEAPLVLNRGFAETMALKRSAGLETVACWQSDAQWTDREVRDQLDALFAHRVYFATASVRDARESVALTMSEFSDTVRPETAHLAALGRPDVRLRLPRHHAVVSWTTPQGRQPAFVARTLPMRADPARLAAQAREQHARGGRHLTDMRQPHWQGSAAATAESEAAAGAAASAASAGQPAAASAASSAKGPAGRADGKAPAALPSTPAPSYAELVALDSAHSIRAVRTRTRRALELPDELDLQLLELAARLGHVLSSQLHRRFNRGRAATTTQRRLKRLADAGFVSRLQFHRRDGGGMPMCYRITPEGLELLLRCGRLLERSRPGADAGGAAGAGAGVGGVGAETAALRRARHEVHVAGWALAFAEAAGPATGRRSRILIEGAETAVLSPPRVGGPARPRAFGPEDLRLPGGRVPHDFLRTTVAGRRVEVERFETLRPHARVASPGRAEEKAIDLLVERDDRHEAAAWIAKLERYDHFLSGWALHTSRYRDEAQLPLVVFVCRSRERAEACAGAADRVLVACRAYAGEYPPDWDYCGRRQIVFAAERDIHEGIPLVEGMLPLPPAVREQLSRAGRAPAESRPLVARAIVPTGIASGRAP